VQPRRQHWFLNALADLVYMSMKDREPPPEPKLIEAQANQPEDEE
jgi:hypothetical protein